MKRLTFMVASAALVALTAALVVPVAAFAEGTGTGSAGSEAAAATEAPASTKDTYQLKVSGMT